MLEIKEATEGISVCLSLHHSKGLFVVCSFTMDWARPDMQLLILNALHILLVLHVLEILEVLIFLFYVCWVLLRGTLLLGRWTWALGLLPSTIDVVGLNLEVLLLFASWARLTSGRASKDAVVPSSRLGTLIRSHVLSTKRVDSPSTGLVGMFVVLFWFTILKLTLSWSWTFLGSATLDQVVVVAHSRMSVSASIARRNTCVARKIEQLLAEWRYAVCSLMESCIFTFLNTLLKNAIHLVLGLGGCCPSISHVSRGFHVSAHFLLVWTDLGSRPCNLACRCFSLCIMAIFSDGRSRFLNFVFLII